MREIETGEPSNVSTLLSDWWPIAFFVSLFSLGVAQDATAQLPGARKHASAVPMTPFGLIFGTTTISEAKAVLSTEGAQFGGQYFVEAKPSTYRDGDPEGVSNERGVLVDVAGLPIERVKEARVGFFDRRLYLLRYTFDTIDTDKLRRQLAEIYGNRGAEEGFMPSEKTITWRSGDVTLVLKPNFMGPPTLTYLHLATFTKLRDSNQQVYQQHIRAKAKQQRGF